MPIILSIEDDDVFADIVRSALVREGFEVVRAIDGEEGLKKALEEKPDAILLDIGLPKIDGFKVLEKLQSDDQTSAIPVVMLSRLSSKEDVDQCFALGCREYLIKTQHSPDDIVHHLRKLVGLAAFTLFEALIVVAAILLLGGLAWWQLAHPKPPVSLPAGNVELQT
jgi:CheY-like chemotaxis protein